MNKTHETSTLFMLLLQYHQKSVDIITGDNEDQVVSRPGISMCMTLHHQWI